MNKEQILKIFKNKNNLTIVLIFIIGVVLMIMAGGNSREKKSVNSANTASVEATDEERLQNILSKIEGAGDVSVMITYYSGTEKTLAYETKTASRETGSERSEDRKAVMTDGEPMVVKEVYPRVKGVIVIADGAGNSAVKAAICEAAAAALDVPAHRICIFKKEEE